MEQSSIQQPKACQVGMCFFPADGHSQYCTHHRSLMEAYDAKLAATELVARCIQCQAKIGSRHTDQCPQPGYVDETQVAVEQAPRPQPNETEKAFAGFLNQRAASSPVARPQTVETYDCDCDDLLCRDNRYCTSAAAARTEQPTKPFCNVHRYELDLQTCEECYEVAYAAPVAEQRPTVSELKQIEQDVLRFVKGAFREYVATPYNIDKVAEYVGRNNAAGEIHDRIVQYFTNKIFASQRTEGEGQPK